MGAFVILGLLALGFAVLASHKGGGEGGGGEGGGGDGAAGGGVDVDDIPIPQPNLPDSFVNAANGLLNQARTLCPDGSETVVKEARRSFVEGGLAKRDPDTLLTDLENRLRAFCDPLTPAPAAADDIDPGVLDDLRSTILTEIGQAILTCPAQLSPLLDLSRRAVEQLVTSADPAAVLTSMRAELTDICQPEVKDDVPPTENGGDGEMTVEEARKRQEEIHTLFLETCVENKPAATAFAMTALAAGAVTQFEAEIAAGTTPRIALQNFRETLQRGCPEAFVAESLESGTITGPHAEILLSMPDRARELLGAEWFTFATALVECEGPKILSYVSQFHKRGGVSPQWLAQVNEYGNGC